MCEGLSKSSSVAVIGAGAMGAGIAHVAALAGHRVILFDVKKDAVSNAIRSIETALGKAIVKGKMCEAEAQSAISRIVAVNDISEIKGVGLVVEAVAERLDVKRKIFADVEAIVEDACILATNTSSISITAIGAQMKRPERLIGMHFFNPAPVMALVEVVSGLATSRDIADCVYSTARDWGKVPVHTKSTPGFIVNRVARPYYAEGLRSLSEKVADAASIDALMREAGQFRMGPLELMDLIGHDVNFAVTESVFSAMFADRRFAPSIIQRELVDGGFLGRKTGRGFFDYSEGAERPEPTIEPLASAPENVKLGPKSSSGAKLQERLIDAGLLVSGERTAEPDVIAEIDGVFLMQTDGRTATKRASEIGREVVLVDFAQDYLATKRVGVSRSMQCAEPAYRAIVGALQRCHYEVVPLKDVAGMVVMRTVAMLVNEASDAVDQGVCSAEDVDLAMEKGVNYPIGPLKWADEVGVELFHRVLINLREHYGEERYRASPLLSAHRWGRMPIHSNAKIVSKLSA
ncbi:3-hydroxyacyl-CoA dehydrogenase [Paraburkholderia pallida]|uniref:3-hydroxyacyl-CoA dehydrogenase n=1 Tax=Paraburkholderia pallida TaxID=2547399 RepID=A0A4P7D4Q0_9BURK|nr:3-hydroxyacyl-CoA dehydrogenase [Paraburkholderia pallida]QBR03669.1 3-hydroxyacyl-CoA dehydrogenase [Paraburkholderia pallida]